MTASALSNLARAAGVAVVALALATTACRIRPEAGPDRTGTAGGQLVFSDDFERPTIGENWVAEGEHWSLDEGWLSVEGARNDALWLQVELPDNVRIEWKARAMSDIGDLKFEVFGDGATHESGYIGIFGGWSNSLNIIARLDEHGDDRLVGADGIRVVPEQVYEMAIVRTDARLRWFVDGELFLEYDDSEPLIGDGHRHFAFNDWDAPVQFDEVRVWDLGP